MMRTKDQNTAAIEMLYGLETAVGLELVRSLIGQIGYRAFTAEALEILAGLHHAREDAETSRRRMA